ncbi:LPS translocon maturation chaperone LptM [Paucibacter sp. TC2R-5]|uniref:LPS translocon maturation chaperone LptM n=1 Tax=Paucibacter sp. TC2R-5 TaxID=2893555 RepID=UPI0039DF7D6D
MMKTYKMLVSVFPPNLAVARTGSKRRQPAALLLTLLACSALLQGCGQKGPLRLPEPAPAASAAASPAKP